VDVLQRSHLHPVGRHHGLQRFGVSNPAPLFSNHMYKNWRKPPVILFNKVIGKNTHVPVRVFTYFVFRALK